ncbi:helix-turn-helix transcriptional regulator [Methylopila sp. 73B]|uniref:helix-turn-helix transcriptional regulator n=1 Tax=Methylopila sp. 73B TaxID=1120792 RepID=UPI0003799C8D|nr:helix-turn-helix transcriptional regulator [Methylopila sp. 73B]
MERFETSGARTFGDAGSASGQGDRICNAMLQDLFGAGTTMLTEGALGSAKGLFWSDHALSLATFYFQKSAVRLQTPGAKRTSVVILRAMDGPAVVHQKRRIVEAERADYVFLSPGEPLDIRLPQGGRLDCACLPPHAPGVTNHRLASLMMRTLPHDFLPLQLLTSYAGYLLQRAPRSRDEASLMVAHFYALLPLVADVSIETPAPKPGRAGSVKARIERGLTDAALSLPDLAAEEGVTSRTLQKLFSREGTTFSRYVLERRLERAKAAILLSPADSPIHRIAYDVGFNDLSYFNRTFRQRYGLSPSELRCSTARDHG